MKSFNVSVRLSDRPTSKRRIIGDDLVEALQDMRGTYAHLTSFDYGEKMMVEISDLNKNRSLKVIAGKDDFNKEDELLISAPYMALMIWQELCLKEECDVEGNSTEQGN